MEEIPRENSVYLVTNLLNNKAYVGKTSYPVETRWGLHRKSARHGSQYYFHRAIRKHGEENFDVQVVAQGLASEEANSLERIWILLLGSYNDEFGYNLTLGGEGQRPNDATRKKISEALRRNTNPNRGRPLSEEHKKKLSEVLTGRVMSEETLRKMSAAQKGHPHDRQHEG